MSKTKSSSARLTGLVLFAGALLMGLMGLIVIAGLFLLGVFGSVQGGAAQTPPSGKIPPETVTARREKEEARLNAYGWVDKQAGVVSIPISQAMVLIADSGLPVGEPTVTPIPTATPTPVAPTEIPGAVAPTSEAAPTATPAPTVDLTNVSFANHVLPIFEEHCTECHGGDKPEEGLRLTSYDEVMTGSMNGSVIEPGDVKNSYLIDQVVSGRMPKKGPKLTPAEIAVITAWVEQGAQDN